MTKQLESLFNMPEQESETEDEVVELPTEKDKVDEMIENVNKIDAALPLVKDIETTDAELDNIAQIAKDAFDDLMDYGMSGDPRNAARMFEVAERMLKTSMDAKINKADKKLKMIDLQIKQRRLDQIDAKEARAAANASVEVDGVLSDGSELDRNEILAQLLAMNSDTDADNSA
jgi:hypothetical protein